MPKILLGVPVRQDPKILKQFLSNLQNLNTNGLELTYLFIDDNDKALSRKLLKDFQDEKPSQVIIWNPPHSELIEYECNEVTHQWNNDLVWRVAEHKNRIIEYALTLDYTHLFFVDSDLVLQPETLSRLLSLDLDIVSEVFWTAWTPDTAELPNVWISGHYDLTPDFVQQLKIPGVYEVGGLGACTLITRKVLESEVNFEKVPSLNLWGEDRHFCYRAKEEGFTLHADTTLPPLHLYRLSDLPQKILLSILVRNEADRYLREVLEHAKQYVDEIVVLDDGSDDNTVEVCESTLDGFPHTIYTSDSSTFSTENTLRETQWANLEKHGADWVLVLDADEIFEDRIITEIKELVKGTNYDAVGFRLYDMWNHSQYREDLYWQAHKHFRPFLVRASAVKDPAFADQPLHCGRFPLAVNKLPARLSSIKLKHLGWAKITDRDLKHWRYKTLDPSAKYGIQAQYDSIKDKNPNLKPFNLKPGISLCMIVKDEEKYLADCLTSARGIVDEIIVVDTGSTDQTEKIANNYGARVFKFNWCNDFSAARNYALEQARHQWILVLDADEKLDTDSQTIIREAIKTDKRFIYSATVINDQQTKQTQHQTARLFPNDDLIRYQNVIHEQPVDKTGEAIDLPLLAFVIHHKGYHPDVVVSRQKNKRNLELLQQRIMSNVLDPLPRMAIAQELESLGNFFEAVDQLRIGIHLCKLMSSPPMLTEQLISDLVNLGLRHENHNLAYHEGKLFLSTYPHITHPGFWVGHAEAQYLMKDPGSGESLKLALQHSNNPILFGSIDDIKNRINQLQDILLQLV